VGAVLPGARLKRESLSRYTGAVCASKAGSPVDSRVPATHRPLQNDYKNQLTIALAVFAVVVFGGLYIRMRHGQTPVARRRPTGRHVPA